MSVLPSGTSSLRPEGDKSKRNGDDTWYFVVVMPFQSRPSVDAAFQKRRGRPKKFGNDTRVVTVRLPEEALAALAEMNDDLSQAIVTAVKHAHPRVIDAPAELEPRRRDPHAYCGADSRARRCRTSGLVR